MAHDIEPFETRVTNLSKDILLLKERLVDDIPEVAYLDNDAAVIIVRAESALLDVYKMLQKELKPNNPPRG